MTWKPSNELWSEQFRLMGEEWADAEAAASLLEDTKSSVMAQNMARFGDIAINKAEMLVRQSDSWMEHIKRIVEARQRANILKIRLKYLELKYWENNSHEANRRKEVNF